jgi:hypothetical protein
LRSDIFCQALGVFRKSINPASSHTETLKADDMNDREAKGFVLIAALLVMFTLTVYVCSVQGLM